MNPQHPRRRATDHWTDEALDVKFEAIDNTLTPMLALPVVVAKLEQRIESLVTGDNLHEELDVLRGQFADAVTDLKESFAAGRRWLIGIIVTLVVALIGASAMIAAAVISNHSHSTTISTSR